MVEPAEPSEEAILDFTTQPADDANRQLAETDAEQNTKQRIDADRPLPVLIQGLREIERLRQCSRPLPPQTIPPPINMPLRVGTDNPLARFRVSIHLVYI